MTLRDILHNKGHQVHSIESSATLDDVVQRLVRHNCGSLVVYDVHSPSSGRMAGIITERDILRACAQRSGSLSDVSVAEAMTTNVVIGAPSDSVENTMGLMTEMRIRHLPVIEDGQLLGLVSIGDVVKWQHDHLTMENHYLKSYLQG